MTRLIMMSISCKSCMMIQVKFKSIVANCACIDYIRACEYTSKANILNLTVWYAIIVFIIQWCFLYALQCPSYND